MALKNYPLFQARIKQTQGTHQTAQNKRRMPVSNMLGNFFSGIMKKINTSSTQNIEESESFQQPVESFSNTFTNTSSNCPSQGNFGRQNQGLKETEASFGNRQSQSIVSAPVMPKRPFKPPTRPGKRKMIRPKMRIKKTIAPSIPKSIQDNLTAKESILSKNQNFSTQVNPANSNSFGELSEHQAFTEVNSQFGFGKNLPNQNNNFAQLNNNIMTFGGGKQISSVTNLGDDFKNNMGANMETKSFKQEENLSKPLGPQMGLPIPKPPSSSRGNLKKKRRIMAKRFVAFDRHNL